jgi:hypothetical protein
MAESQTRAGEIKERLEKTPEGAIHHMTDTETGKTASVAISQETLAILLAFAKELRKPDDETQRLKDEAKARHDENIRQMIAVATAEEDARKNRYATCNHKKERGEPAWVGQPFSDGFYRAICLHCQMISTPIKLTPAMMSGMA